MPQNDRPLYPAFSQGDDKPLAETILPLGNGRAVMSQMWPEGVFTALGWFDDQTGEFIGSSGHFKAHRPCTSKRTK